MSKTALKKRKAIITKSLRKSGIHSLQEVLNTSIISNDAKIKHIRHTYTCYNRYLKIFYRDEVGKQLREELNTFILGLVNGKYTADDLEVFNKQLKIKLKAANDNYIQECRKALITNTPINNKPVKHFEYTAPPQLSGLNEKEKAAVAAFSPKMFNNTMTEERKIEICKIALANRKEDWKKHYKEAKSPIRKFIVELYLLKRDPNFYPADFSDLDYMCWKDVVSLAKQWLLNIFDNDNIIYTKFIKEQLPLWIKNNAKTHEDEILEKLDV